VELLISARADKGGELNSTQCRLDSAITLGRGPESPVPLDATGISREHLRLHREGDALFLTDLSSNGTWLNAARLNRGEPHRFTVADVIKVPGFEIRVNSREAVPSAAAAATVPEVPATPMASVRAFGASLSMTDRFLIALALATLTLAVLYFTS
jgi:predicted component of type VI protein secretion system